ncbi:MAG: uroporphyrinogen decarboxylase [Acidimicrobiia bacterium]
MTRLLAALNRQALDRPPVWMMRQAGRYLPEYQELRSRHTFHEAMTSPDLAAEITLQPLRRFRFDAAIVFSDIMTPLEAMGVPIEFTPGPKLSPLTLEQVGALEPLEPVPYVGETIQRVRAALDPDVAVIGFAGGPVTLLAYLLEGGGSRHFPQFRRALHGDDPGPALSLLADSVGTHLQAQVDAGAQVVQLFDTWAGLLSAEQFRELAVPAARRALARVSAPSIYFVPAASHLLDLMPQVGATALGVDWRLGLDRIWDRVGEGAVLQGNLDPALLLTDPATVITATRRVLAQAGGRPGHVFNLGHGVLPATPVENVEAMVRTILEASDDRAERTLTG